MSGQRLRDEAQKYRKAGLLCVERGQRDGFDTSAEAVEYANVAAILERAANAVDELEPASAQDYTHRMLAALSLRLGLILTEAREVEEP